MENTRRDLVKGSAGMLIPGAAGGASEWKTTEPFKSVLTGDKAYIVTGGGQDFHASERRRVFENDGVL